jgi:hypothetical protein
VDKRDADPFPFVHNYFGTYEVYCTAGSIPSCTNTNTTTPGRGLGCYTLAVPQGYRDRTSADLNSTDINYAQHDYAFVDFGNCPWTTNDAFPGWQTGMLNANTTVAMADANAAGVTNMWGYPGVALGVTRVSQWWQDPAGGGNHKPNYQTAELWGMTGTAIVDSEASTQARYTIDSSGGQSGAAVWRVLNNVRRMIGIHRGQSDQSDKNWARRLDATVRNFGQSSTTW